MRAARCQAVGCARARLIRVAAECPPAWAARPRCCRAPDAAPSWPSALPRAERLESHALCYLLPLSALSASSVIDDVGRAASSPSAAIRATRVAMKLTLPLGSREHEVQRAIVGRDPPDAAGTALRGRARDGSSLPSTNGGGPSFEVRSRKALAHALRAPGQLGLGRAYVSASCGGRRRRGARTARRVGAAAARPAGPGRLALAALRACGPMRPRAPPKAELRPRGRRHSPERDARSVRHHYDVSTTSSA